MKKHSFVLKVDATQLVHVLDPAYQAWVSESKKDDELHGGPQDELAEAGYPEFRELIANPALSATVLGGYLREEFFGAFTWDGRSAIQYWLDEVTSCRLEDGTVNVSGYCYSNKMDESGDMGPG